MNEYSKIKLLSIAKEAALKAGNYLLNPEQSLMAINSEIGKDIKIKADIASEEIIINYLKQNTEFSILSEESEKIERSEQEFIWIVDPLDGSMNYFRSIPLCCVSIGLWHKMEPVIGVVYDFFRSELFTGIVGKGAWLNEQEIKPSAIDKKQSAVLCTGFPVNTDFSAEALMSFIQDVQNFKKLRLLGSAALSLSYVASGRADAYMENDIMIWDTAGGLAIASGAGCKLDIRNGKKLNSLCVAVSNGKFNPC